MKETNWVDKWCQMDLEDLKPYVERFSRKEFGELLLSDCENYDALKRLRDHFDFLYKEYATQRQDPSFTEQDEEAYQYCIAANMTLGLCSVNYPKVCNTYQLLTECKQKNNLAYQFKVQRKIQAELNALLRPHKADMMLFKPARDKIIELSEFSDAFTNRIKAEIAKQQAEYEAMALHDQMAHQEEEQFLVLRYNDLIYQLQAKKNK